MSDDHVVDIQTNRLCVLLLLLNLLLPISWLVKIRSILRWRIAKISQIHFAQNIHFILSPNYLLNSKNNKRSCKLENCDFKLYSFNLNGFLTFRIRPHIPGIVVLILRLAVSSTSLPPLRGGPSSVQTVWFKLRRPVRKSQTNRRSEDFVASGCLDDSWSFFQFIINFSCATLTFLIKMMKYVIIIPQSSFATSTPIQRKNTAYSGAYWTGSSSGIESPTAQFFPLHKSLEDEINRLFSETSLNLNLGGGTTAKHETGEYSVSISIQLFFRECSYPFFVTDFRDNNSG